MKLKTIVLYGGGALLGSLALVQLVPYGRAHTNPPVVREPSWDSPRTRELAVRACFDCHSNETRWPWYSHVAPISWLVQRDVDEGREALNFSRFDQPQKEAGEAAEETVEGSMPPWFYLPTHPTARLTAAEQQELVRGLRATLGGEAEHEERAGGR
jgi:hypothetical protein